MAKNRFKKVYSQGGASERIKIYVDTKIGVNYIVAYNGIGFGSPYITPLLDKDGKPVVTPVNE